MITALRKQFNEAFSPAKYDAYLQELHNVHPTQLTFRVAETPEFIPKDFKNKILSCCEAIVDKIIDPGFIELTNKAVPNNLQVPNETAQSDFIAFDFGVCKTASGEIVPKLIEMQGFPTLFCYQILHDEITRKHFNIPENFDCYLNGYNKETYIKLLKEVILGNEKPENVILLEIFPREQKTRIDFFCTETYLGIKMVCLTELIEENNNLYYLNNGVKTPIKRIYNRVIFDDLHQQTPEVQEKGKLLFKPLNVSWVPHPAWFYRISKYTIPFIQHEYIPRTHFLHMLTSIPADLENFVLKPLFSFAGQGVIIDVTPEDISAVKDPENWILQEKVTYADIIETPDVPAKFEVRIFYFWPPGAKRPIATNNLTRLSKGKMVGVRYNADKEWVGGSLAYFEKG
jgi:hypothetical protein